jgi:hypothetical protein
MQPSLIETFDVDNDGDQDIITGSHSFDNLVLVKNLGSFQFGTPQVITNLVNGPKKVTGADLNNDGWTDLISTTESDDKIAYYLNSGGTGFGPQHILSTSITDPHGVTATDLDDDGDVDIAVTGSSSWYNTGWFRNLGGGTFSPIIYFQTVISPCGGSNIFAEDIDQDGDPDIVSPGNQIFLSESWKQYFRPTTISAGKLWLFRRDGHDRHEHGWLQRHCCIWNKRNQMP